MRVLPNSHAATTAAQLPGGAGWSGRCWPTGTAPVSAKLRALLDIADLVPVDGRLVSADAVAKARAAGATDVEIHDTVLIAAAFCMYNRYVDGLGRPCPTTPPSTPLVLKSSSSTVTARLGEPA